MSASSQHHLRVNHGLPLTPEFQKREQALAQDRPHHHPSSAEVEKLGTQSVMAQHGAHAGFEDRQRVQLVFRVLDGGGIPQFIADGTPVHYGFELVNYPFLLRNSIPLVRRHHRRSIPPPRPW